MHESHCPVYSVPRGANGAIVGQQQEVPMRETTLDPSFPRSIFSPSQCHSAAVLSSTQVQGSPLGPLLLTHFSRLTPLHTKSRTRSQITQYKDFKLEETMQKRSFISKRDNKILHNGTRMLYAILKEHLLALGTKVSTQVNQLKQTNLSLYCGM